MGHPLDENDFKRAELLTAEDYEPMERTADLLTNENSLIDKSLIEGDIKLNVSIGTQMNRFYSF